MQLQTNLERAEEAGLRDVVTAIGNRRFFDACFAGEVEKAREVRATPFASRSPTSTNSSMSTTVSAIWSATVCCACSPTSWCKNVRGQDKVARFGGEEFALIFPGARLGEAVSAVERIRGVLESKQWTIEPSGERVGKVTASFGVGRLRADEVAQ